MPSHTHLHEYRAQATAHLTQTMSFLAMPTAELEAVLVQELNNNPALELVDEPICPTCGRRLKQFPCLACAAPREDGGSVVYLSPYEQRFQRVMGVPAAEARETQTPERLDDHILRQISPLLNRTDRALATYLLARLDEDGLLPESAAEVAVFNRVSLATVERVLQLIRHADPVGVGACSPQESLLIQLDALAEVASAPLLHLARRIVCEQFEALGKADHARIARRLQQPVALVEQAAHFIHRNLTPYPARAFWGEGKTPAGADQATLHNPDAIISCPPHVPAQPFFIEVFTPLSGFLRVNPEFKNALVDNTSVDREKWSAALERAALVTKCLRQRNHTLCRLIGLVADTQRDFILSGDGHLRPLTRSQIAESLGVHESTISRAVAGKTVALPNGRIIPIAKFFDRSLSVRDRVKTLIESETEPLTDEAIAVALEAQGVSVARRTVAKYRNMLGLLPAHLRGRSKRT